MKLKSIAKGKVWRIFQKGIGGRILLNLLLRFADNWGVKRNDARKYDFPFFIKRKNTSFQILCYHRVNDDQHPFFGGIPVKTFSAQMEQLQKHCCVLPLEELVERRRRRDVPGRAVAITFDDGYKDNFTNAFPILRELRLPATIFLTTGGIDSGEWLWHDKVFEAFHYTDVQMLNLKGQSHPLTTRKEKLVALDAILKRLRELHPEDRDRLIQDLIGELNPDHQSFSGQDKLAWEDVRTMSQNDIAFGAHTVSHPILSRLSLEEAGQEIMDSKNAIEKHIVGNVRLFAYPNGSRKDFNQAIKDFLKNNQFQCAVTTIWGTNDKETDLFELRRMNVENIDPSVLVSRLGYFKFAS